MNSGDVFTKHANGRDRGQPLYEAAGLAWLAGGGMPVAEVVAATPTSLTTRLIPTAPPSARVARQLGGDLARMHAAGAPHYGAPPAGYQGPGWMGRAPLELLPAPPPSWGWFYARKRILPYVTNVFTPAEKEVIRTLADRLESGALDHGQPALVQENGYRAARIHGDLWGGNIMWQPERAVLIDPAAQGGHAEEDLAALRVFSAPFADQVVSGYQHVSPLAPGWQQRICLHKMHILIVHCYLFGRSYVPQTVACARESLEVPIA